MSDRINITAKFIKKYVEKATDLDLSSKSRKRDVVDTRRVAFKLTKSLTKSSLDSIGELYNKDHATVLHGIRTYDSLCDSPDFIYYKRMYNRIFTAFMDIHYNVGTDREIKDLEELHVFYQNKIDKIVKESKEKMSNLLIQNERLRTNPMFDKICKLPEREFKDLEVRFNAFFQMNAMNSERKRLRNVV